MNIKRLFKGLFSPRSIEVPTEEKQVNLEVIEKLRRDMEAFSSGRIGLYDYLTIKKNLKANPCLDNVEKLAIEKLQKLDSSINADYLKERIEELIQFLKEKEFYTIEEEDTAYKNKRNTLEKERREALDCVEKLKQHIAIEKEKANTLKEHIVVITEHTLVKRQEIRDTFQVIIENLEKEKKDLE